MSDMTERLREAIIRHRDALDSDDVTEHDTALWATLEPDIEYSVTTERTVTLEETWAVTAPAGSSPEKLMEIIDEHDGVGPTVLLGEDVADNVSPREYVRSTP